VPIKTVWGAIVIACTLIGTAVSSVASDQVITAFDGTYFGQRERLDPLSGDLCATFTLHSLTVGGGRLHGDSGDIVGSVAASGFFTGTIKIFGLVQPFEGRIENDTLLGGVVSLDGACFWLLRMTRLEEGN